VRSHAGLAGRSGPANRARWPLALVGHAQLAMGREIAPPVLTEPASRLDARGFGAEEIVLHERVDKAAQGTPREQTVGRGIERCDGVGGGDP